MKNSWPIFISIFLFLVPVYSNGSEESGTNDKPAFSFSFSTVALSQYVYAETGDNYHNKPVLQSEIGMETRQGIYASIWHSTGFDDNLSSDGGDEIDYFIGCAGDIGFISVDLGFAYFDSVNLFQGPKDDTFYLYAQLGHTFTVSAGSLTPLVKGNFYINGDDSEVEGGVVMCWGFDYEPPTPSWMSVPTSFRLAYDDGAFGNNAGIISRIGTEVRWVISEHLNITIPSVNLYFPLTTNDERDNEIVVGGGISVSF